MAGLVVAVLVMATQADAWQQTVTEHSCQNFSLPTTLPAIVFIKYSAERAPKAVSLEIKFSKNRNYSEDFTFTKDDEERILVALILRENRASVFNMQTGKMITWRILSWLSICSDQLATLEVFTFPPAPMNVSTTPPPPPVTPMNMNTTLPPTCTLSHLNPTILSLASICALLALSTLLLGFLHCRRCASDKNGLRHAASNSHPMTFRSNEALVNEQASSSSSRSTGRGSLHISENSLYGVIL